MAEGFESLVRPAQAPDISPARKSISSACEESPATVVLQFGRGHYGEVHHVSYSIAVKNYMTRREQEVKAT